MHTPVFGEQVSGVGILFGQGQFIQPETSPLIGDSHIPFMGGCLNAPCGDGGDWEFLRTNVGLVNPNPEPLQVEGTLIPFGREAGADPSEFEEYERFTKVLPPYGWLQFNLVPSQTYGHDLWGEPIVASTGYVVSLTTDKELPYYAYASVVFSPDPDSGIPEFNDPMFVPAEPGYVAPFAEAVP